MKKTITFIIILISSKVLSQADSTKLAYYNGDTLLYFSKVFEANKQLYTNKPLNELLKKFDIAPKFFYEDINIKDINKTHSISLFFIPRNKYDSMVSAVMPQKVIKLKITFLGLLPDSDSTNIISKQEQGNWTRSTRNYFKNHILKDFHFFAY